MLIIKNEKPFSFGADIDDSVESSNRESIFLFVSWDLVTVVVKYLAYSVHSKASQADIGSTVKLEASLKYIVMTEANKLFKPHAV